MKLKALIFDVDGTLADTEEAHRRAFNAAFQEQGLDWHWSRPQYARLLLTTGGKERLAAHVQSLNLDAIESASLSSRIPAIHSVKTRIYTQMVKSGAVALRDGIERLFDEAERNGVSLSIASTTTFANIESLLTTHLGPSALQRFAVIGSADDVTTKKPAPDVYEYVLRELGCDAGVCAAVEDSANGLKAAKAAGLFTVVTPCFWTADDDFSAADMLLPGFGTGFGIRQIDERLQLQVRAA